MKKTSRRVDDNWYFKFEPAAWLTDVDLLSCSWGARGVWISCLCHMHNTNPRGVLTGKIEDLARILGDSPQNIAPYILELERHGVFSRCRDVDPAPPCDAIVSRRMWREHHLKQALTEGGRKGGLKSRPPQKPKRSPSKALSKPTGTQAVQVNPAPDNDLPADIESQAEAKAKPSYSYSYSHSEKENTEGASPPAAADSIPANLFKEDPDILEALKAVPAGWHARLLEVFIEGNMDKAAALDATAQWGHFVEAPTKADEMAADVKEFKRRWNEWAKVSQAEAKAEGREDGEWVAGIRGKSGWGPERQASWRARWNAEWQRDWRVALNKARESRFCNGGGEQGWYANVDWFLKPGKVNKLMEDQYANRKQRKPESAAPAAFTGSHDYGDADD